MRKKLIVRFVLQALNKKRILQFQPSREWEQNRRVVVCSLLNSHPWWYTYCAALLCSFPGLTVSLAKSAGSLQSRETFECFGCPHFSINNHAHHFQTCSAHFTATSKTNSLCAAKGSPTYLPAFLSKLPKRNAIHGFPVDGSDDRNS